MMTKGITAVSLAHAAFAYASATVNAPNIVNYGVDVSFPIHHNFLSGGSLTDTISQFGNDRIETYSKFLFGCIEKYGPRSQGHLCHENEKERLRYNMDQPRAMTNYTSTGFHKTRLSENTWERIKDFWNDKKKNVENVPDGFHNEAWPPANTYTNHW